jgi:aminopeptidase B
MNMMEVHAVTLPSEGDLDLAFEVEAFADFGKALRITLPPPSPGWGWSQLNVCVSYTAGAGPALCWLDPAQTAGKVHPCLFTQGQACLNRSLFPCMDTPSVRITYTASVTAPAALRVIMGAGGNFSPEDTAAETVAAPEPEQDEAEGVETAAVEAAGSRSTRAAKLSSFTMTSGTSVSHFKMEQAIPCYLIALAVGDLRCVEVGPRSRVYAEPSLLAAARVPS